MDCALGVCARGSTFVSRSEMTITSKNGTCRSPLQPTKSCSQHKSIESIITKSNSTSEHAGMTYGGAGKALERVSLMRTIEEH